MSGVKFYWPYQDCCSRGTGEEYPLFPDLITEFGADVASVGVQNTAAAKYLAGSGTEFMLAGWESLLWAAVVPRRI